MTARRKQRSAARSPAEEAGAAARDLSRRAGEAIRGLPPAARAALGARVDELARRRHIVYVRDGVVEPVRVLPCPLVVVPEQLGYLHHVALTVQTALKRMPDLYFGDRAARAILRLSPGEEEWLRACWRPSRRESVPIFGRLDAVARLDEPGWKESLRLIEPNLSGIGGLHKAPSCDAILAEAVVPAFAARDPGLWLERGADVRELLLQEVLDHLEAIGRRGTRLCLVEPKYARDGPDEQVVLARYLHDRHGIEVVHADPSELSARAGEVWHGRSRIDVAYRDYSVLDLIELEREGVDVEPMRLLFRQNRVISSIAAELDQKSCWEILTEPELLGRHFAAEEREVFRRHVLWTRLVSDRRAVLPDGTAGDLLAYARTRRAGLVLKPNRAYGGEGVLLGDSATAAAWDAAIEHAVTGPDRWVVQERARAPRRAVPVLGPDGRVGDESLYTVIGLAPSRYGVAVLARASRDPVVNLARGGGICGVLVGRAPARPAVSPSYASRGRSEGSRASRRGSIP